MAAERQDSLREFVAVTGAEEDRARFFLESAGWDLQVAPRGGPRRAGWGLRGAGVWRDKPAVAEAHSHPAGPRPDPGLRVLGPLATRRQLGLGVGKRGLAPAPTCCTRPQFPLLPGSRVGEIWGTAAARVKRESLGAWLPRRV